MRHPRISNESAVDFDVSGGPHFFFAEENDSSPKKTSETPGDDPVVTFLLSPNRWRSPPITFEFGSRELTHHPNFRSRLFHHLEKIFWR